MHILTDIFNLDDMARILVRVDMAEISTRVDNAEILTYADDETDFTYADIVKVLTHIYKGKIWPKLYVKRDFDPNW